VHLWLKFYVQGRLVETGKRATFLESMATFIVSAFWHGFYPSYYIMFFFAAILSEVNKDIFKAGILFHKYIPASIRPIVANFAALFQMNYLGVVFTATTWSNTVFFLKATYAIPWILLLLALFYSRGTNMVGRAKKLEAKLAALQEKKKD
jgi:hypothetical protein